MRGSGRREFPEHPYRVLRGPVRLHAARMEVGPRRAVANLPQALDESVEPWRRVPFSCREFVRRDEERRHLALRFEETKQSRGCNGTPAGGLKPANDRWLTERAEPQRADCTPIRSGRNTETTRARPDHLADRIRTRSGVDQKVDSQEVFLGERQNRSNPTASFRGDTMTVAQQDSQSDLRTLRGAQRTRAVPFLACFRIGAAQHGGVGRGDADPGRFLRSAEGRAQERRGWAEWIDIDEIVPRFAQTVGQVAQMDVGGGAGWAKGFWGAPRCSPVPNG